MLIANSYSEFIILPVKLHLTGQLLLSSIQVFPAKLLVLPHGNFTICYSETA